MVRPLRILQIVGGLDVGGIEALLCSIMRRIDHSELRFDFIKHNPEKGHYEEEIRAMGGEIYTAPPPHREGLFAYLSWLRRFFREHREYEVAHGHYPLYASVYLGMARMYGLRTVAHAHLAAPFSPIESLPVRIGRYVLQFPLASIAEYRMACSDDAAKNIFGKRTAEKKDYIFFPNARETAVFAYSQAKRDEMRKKMGLEGKFAICHVGRFEKQKNHVFLINVFKKLCVLSPESRLVLLGDGPLRPEMRKFAEEAGLAGKVIFTGNVPNPQDYYQAMDVFVLPSLSEGLPLTMVEAQISGLPCVMAAHLPQEADLGCGLVSQIGLERPLNEWADLILRQKGLERISRLEVAVKKGFDINSAAARLRDFYISICEK